MSLMWAAVDPACQAWVPNDCGSLNSVVDVA
jgi:hypothetical protein